MGLFLRGTTCTRMSPRSLDSPGLSVSSLSASAESFTSFLPVRISENLTPGVKALQPESSLGIGCRCGNGGPDARCRQRWVMHMNADAGERLALRVDQPARDDAPRLQGDSNAFLLIATHHHMSDQLAVLVNEGDRPRRLSGAGRSP